VNGSNSRRWPSFMGIDTRAEAEHEGASADDTGALCEGGGAVSDDERSCVRELERECAAEREAGFCVCERV